MGKQLAPRCLMLICSRCIVMLWLCCYLRLYTYCNLSRKLPAQKPYAGQVLGKLCKPFQRTSEKEPRPQIRGNLLESVSVDVWCGALTSAVRWSNIGSMMSTNFISKPNKDLYIHKFVKLETSDWHCRKNMCSSYRRIIDVGFAIKECFQFKDHISWNNPFPALCSPKKCYEPWAMKRLKKSYWIS